MRDAATVEAESHLRDGLPGDPVDWTGEDSMTYKRRVRALRGGPELNVGDLVRAVGDSVFRWAWTEGG